VRANVASNPSTPVKILTKLVKDKDKDIRIGVAENPSTPINLLMNLAKDKDIIVRKGVLRNLNITHEIKEIIKTIDISQILTE